MFTGIIRGIGRITERTPVGGDCRFGFDLGTAALTDLAIGDSVAVNGACLTVTGCGDGRFTADVSLETLAVTTLGRLEVGATVNLEPALCVGDSLSGHFVSGHVDGVGEVRALAAVAVHDHRTQLITDALSDARILLHEHDLVALGQKLLGQIEADAASAHDDHEHVSGPL